MITINLFLILIIAVAVGFVIAITSVLLAWWIARKGYDNGVRMYRGHSLIAGTPEDAEEKVFYDHSPRKKSKNIPVQFIPEASDDEVEEMNKPAWYKRIMKGVHKIKKEDYDSE